MISLSMRTISAVVYCGAARPAPSFESAEFTALPHVAQIPVAPRRSVSLPHAAIEHGLQNGSLVLNCRTLEDVIARIGDGLLHCLFRLLSVRD